jgi:alpha-L-arabinofuranosidase
MRRIGSPPERCGPSRLVAPSFGPARQRRRLSRNSVLLAALLLVVWPSIPSAQAQSQNLSVEVRVRPRAEKGRISPYIFGAGIDAKTNPLRAPKYPEKVLRDIAESGLRIARYPGGFVFNRNEHRGSWANFYWQDHIGKNPDRRPTEVYDLDTFLQLCERFAIEPLMQINFVGETEESVRGYLEYLLGDGDIDHDGVNWADKRKANGRAQPYKITFWELGNEVHSYPQGFRENAEGAKEYARALDRLVPVIRKMSPGAKVLVPFINLQRPRSEAKPKPGAPDINFTTSHEFALAFLEHLRVPVDYLDWHFYPANGWNGQYSYLGTEDEWKHLYCWGTKFRECHDVVARLIQAKCKLEPRPKIIVGEWSADWTGGIFREHAHSFRGSLMRTMASAVFMADQLLFMMEKSVPAEDIYAAFWHTFSNDAQALFSVQTTREQGLAYKGKSTDEGYGYRMPVYWVFKLLSEQRGEMLVQSLLRGDNTIAAPQSGLYFDPEYAFSRVSHCASRSGDHLYLALLNKDAHQPVTVRVSIEDWRLKPQVEVHEVRADSYLEENTVQRPDAVKPSGPRVDRAQESGQMTYLLKPNTLAVLRFQCDANRAPEQ